MDGMGERACRRRSTSASALARRIRGFRSVALSRLPPAAGRATRVADRHADAAGRGGMAAVPALRIPAGARDARFLPGRADRPFRARRRCTRRCARPPQADDATQTALASVSVALALLSHTNRTSPGAIYALALVA